MNGKIFFNIILVFITLITVIWLGILVVKEERKDWKKRKYYNKTIKYEIDYFLYYDMVKQMKKIILKKTIELYLLQTLVFMKGLFVWKK